MTAVPPSRPSAPRRRLRAALAWLHLWVGLTVGLAFAVLGASGSALVFHNELLRATHPSLDAHVPRADPEVMARLFAEWQPQGMRALDLPRGSLPVWQGYFADGSRRLFAPADGEVLLVRRTDTDPLLWLHELHTHLLAGETGEQIAGVVGWVALFMLLSGLYLWWPRLSRLASHLRIYAGPPVRRWLTWHRSAGVVLLPLLLLAVLTGLGQVYHGLARTVLRADAPPPPPVVTAGVPVDWGRVLEGVRGAWPHGEVVRLAPARDGVVTARVRHRGEWHPNGRSLVHVGARGELLGVYDAQAASAGTRAEAALYPLHIGMAGGLPYRGVTVLVGLLPAFLLVTGFLFWRRRRGK